MRMLLTGAAIWGAFALSGCATMETEAPGESDAPSQASGTLLIGNKGEDSVSFVDLASGAELGRAATGRNPHEIAISPDGRQAAVVSYGAHHIDIFDVASRQRLRVIDLSPNAGPHGIAWLDDGRILATTERSRSLTIVDTARQDQVRQVATDREGTHMVAVSADARRAYTADMQSATITAIDLVGERRLGAVQVGGTPEAIAVSPDGRTIWSSDNAGARVHAFDAAALERGESAPLIDILYTVEGAAAAEIERTVAGPIAEALAALPGAAGTENWTADGRGWTRVRFAEGTATDGLEARAVAAVRQASGTFPQGRTDISPRLMTATPLATLPTGEVPIRVLVSPDGRWVVTSDMGDATITVIDAAERRVVRTIPVGSGRETGQVTILFSDDGRRLYVAETGRDRIAEVDMATGTVLRRLPAGRQGDGLAIAP